MEQHQVLCRNGCGFYSNQGKDGLCSVCYKEMIKKKQQPPVNMPASLTPTSTASKPTTSSHQASGSVETATPTVVLPKTQPVKGTEVENETKVVPSSSSEDSNRKESGKIKKNRCISCKKKVGLSGGFSCRCGGLFCALHRYSDEHECTFDYKELGAEEIRKSNPVVVANSFLKSRVG